MPISGGVSAQSTYAPDSLYARIEEAVKATYIRALKVVPPDLKAAIAKARETETSPTGIDVLDVMLETIDVADGVT